MKLEQRGMNFFPNTPVQWSQFSVNLVQKTFIMYLTFEMERLGRNLSQSVGVKMFRKFWGSYNWNWRLYINNVRKRTSSSFFKKQKFFLSNDSLEVYSKVISFGRKISADSSLQGDKYLCHLGLKFEPTTSWSRDNRDDICFCITIVDRTSYL